MKFNEQISSYLKELQDRLLHLGSHMHYAVSDIEGRSEALQSKLPSSTEEFARLQRPLESINQLLVKLNECAAEAERLGAEVARDVDSKPVADIVSQKAKELHVSVGRRNLFGNVDWKVITIAEFNALHAGRRRALLANNLVRFIDSECRPVPLSTGLRALRGER